MSLFAVQRIKLFLLTMNHHDIHRGFTAELIGKITATEDRVDRILADLAAKREVHCAGDGDDALWYIDPIYAENNEAKFIPAKDIKK
jgi:hypothetical protein